MNKNIITSCNINCSIDDLMRDIKLTKDPIKKTILRKFLDIKMSQMRVINEDPSLDNLSSDISTDESTDESTDKSTGSNISTKPKIIHNEKSNMNRPNIKITKKGKNDPKRSELSAEECKEILMHQGDNIKEIEKYAKIKAYMDLVKDNTDTDTNETNTNDNDNSHNQRKDEKIINDTKEALIKTRGKTEELWQKQAIIDPKYSRYQKDDIMNNKFMERLNSEIDFRTDDYTFDIERPFDDDVNDVIGVYAKYDNHDIDNDIKFKSKDNIKNTMPRRKTLERRTYK